MTNIRAYGHSAVMHILRATTRGEVPSGNFLKVPFYSSTLGGTKSFDENALAGQGRDAQKPVAGPLNVGGNIEIALDPRYSGVWLTSLLGDPDTTSEEGVYTHVFKSGKAVLPDYAIEVGHPDTATAAYFMNSGVQVNSLTHTMSRSGAVRTTLDLLGLNEVKGSASQAGTPAAFTLAQFGHPQGVLKSGGNPLANVRGFNFTYSNNLIPVETVNNGGNLEGIDPGGGTLTGTADLLFANQALINSVFAGTPVDLEVSYQISAALKLTLSMHEVLFDRQPRGIEGPAGISVPAPFRGNRNTSAGCMMTVTLINDLPRINYAPDPE